MFHMMRGAGGFSEFWGSEDQRRAILAEVREDMAKEQEGCESFLCSRVCFVSTIIDEAIEGDMFALENLFGVSELAPVPPIFRIGLGCSSEVMRRIASDNSSA